MEKIKAGTPHLFTVRGAALAYAALTALRVASGIASGSGALTADGVCSFGAAAACLTSLCGGLMASRGGDKKHQYGHDRFGGVIELALSSTLLLLAAATALFCAMKPAAEPSALAIAAASVSLAGEAAVFIFTKKRAHGLVCSAVVLAASIGTYLGAASFDTAGCAVAAVCLLTDAALAFRGGTRRLTDRAVDIGTAKALEAIILEQDGVRGIDSLQTRVVGERYFVDVEIRADGEQTLNSSHEVAQCVHDAIEERFPLVEHCMVHVNPDAGEESEII